MNEAKRLLRYVFPGLVLMLEVGIYLSICHTSALRDYMKILLNTDSSLAVTLLTLLASGGFGYLLSVIYQALYWTCLFDKCGANYKQLFIDANERKWLEIRNRNTGNPIHPAQLSRRGAWRAISAFSNVKEKEFPDRASKRADSLSDLVHGLGASLIGSVLALLIWVSLCLSTAKQSFNAGLEEHGLAIILAFGLAILIIIAHYVNYKQTAKNVQSTAEIMLCDMLKKYAIKPVKTPKTHGPTKKSKPEIIYISPIDLMD